MNSAEQAPACDLPHIRFFGMGDDADGLPALAEVGGKAINLCKLTRAKFPVPPGFVVTTAAYAGFVGREPASARGSPSLPRRSRRATRRRSTPVSAQIRALLADSPCHRSLAEEILPAYRRLRDAGGERVAVALLGHRRGPTRGEFRRATRHVPECPRRGSRCSRRCKPAGAASGRPGPLPTAPSKRPPRRAWPWPSSSSKWSWPTPRESCSRPTPSAAPATRSSSTRPGGWARPSWAAR